MKNPGHLSDDSYSLTLSRRELLAAWAIATSGVIISATAGSAASHAGTTDNQKSATRKENLMNTKAFVYTELQNSVPFSSVPWRDLNAMIARQPGFINKTWLSGVGNNSVGGLYSFDSIENAKLYCTDFFPNEIALKLGVAQTTRVFDATLVKAASLDMGSPHFGAAPAVIPGAFVYTEVQVNVPFEKAPWQDRNPVLKQQKGLISKLWLNGLNTNTLGGLDAFDTIENAKAFAIEEFPKTAAKMNAAFYTRVFDAKAAEAASRDLNSPYYA